MIRLEPRFAELAAMTNFSFLRGASHPEEMVARAAELGLAGIGIADRNTLAGVVRAHVFARENKAALAGMRVVPRRAARLRRRDAGRPRLSEGPRGLRPALPDSHRGKSARAEGRVPARARGSHRAWRGAADRGAAPHPALRATFSRKREKGRAPLSRKGRRKTPVSHGLCGRGGVRALSPPARSLRPAPVDRREPDLRRGHARGAGAARGAGEEARRAAPCDQRRADACARAARARRRRRLHPREA